MTRLTTITLALLALFGAAWAGLEKVSRIDLSSTWPASIGPASAGPAVPHPAATGSVETDRSAEVVPVGGLVLTDRQGRWLRFEPEADGRRRLILSRTPELVGRAFIAAEDKRFHDHFGVDPLAIVRAAWSNLTAGRVVSGASTLTQQLARLTHHRAPGWAGKAVEALRAIRLEQALTKDQILNRYINTIPLGRNLIGAEAAAWGYFGRSADQLDPAQAAALACLAKAPSRLDPARSGPARLTERRDAVLARMAELGMIDQAELKAALAEPVTVRPPGFPFRAGHLTELVLENAPPGSGRIRTSLDLNLQTEVEAVLAAHRIRLKYRGAGQAAAVVVHNPTREVLALAGSLDYGPTGSGFVNGAIAWRAAGSTLKPFLYGLALDRGLTAAEVIGDLRQAYPSATGAFLPSNYDRRAYGPTSFREALANSLNLSAVRLLKRVGIRPFHGLLTQLNLINRPQVPADHYGLGLAVGHPEVSLLQLAAAYAALADHGFYKGLRLTLEEAPAFGRQVLSPQAAYIIADILSDPAARSISFGASPVMRFPFPVAVKTGTSTRHRDCWVVGFTPDYTVAVWTGNFDGRATWGLSGATGPGPIMKDIILSLHQDRPPVWPTRPDGVEAVSVCAASGQKPGPHCRQTRTELFLVGSAPKTICAYHRSDDPVHRIPAAYAGWLHDRYRRGTAGAYRLAGFSPSLDRTFRPPSPSPAASPHGLGLPPAARPAPGRSAVRIITPLPGEIYLAPPGGEQPIAFRARVNRPVSRLSWLIDGREVGAVGPPYRLTRSLPPGRHTVAALTPDGSGEMVEFRVE